MINYLNFVYIYDEKGFVCQTKARIELDTEKFFKKNDLVKFFYGEERLFNYYDLRNENDEILMLNEKNELQVYTENDIKNLLNENLSDYLTLLNLTDNINLKTKDYLLNNLSPIDAFKEELSKVYQIKENENIKSFDYDLFKEKCNNLVYLSGQLNACSKEILYNHQIIITTIKTLNSIFYHENKSIPKQDRLNNLLNLEYDEDGNEHLYYKFPNLCDFKYLINAHLGKINKAKKNKM